MTTCSGLPLEAANLARRACSAATSAADFALHVFKNVASFSLHADGSAGVHDGMPCDGNDDGWGGAIHDMLHPLNILG